MDANPINPDRCKSGGIEKYVGDQLVVALPDAREVGRALDNASVTWTEQDRDAKLGLALLNLTNLAHDAAKLREGDQSAWNTRGAAGPGGTAGDSEGTGARGGDSEMSDLDFLLKRLRYRFGRDYRGWIPTIGKNRVLAPVRGFPYVGGGGQGDPYVGGGGQGDPYVGGGAEGGSVAGTDQGDPYVGGGGAGDPQLSSPLVQWQPRASEPGSGVRVALLDTQLYPNPWLAGAYLAPTQALFELPPPGGSADPASLPKASQGHATFIAGLILHRAPGAQLYVRSVLNADALGDVWEAAKKMVEFTDSGVDIINLSFGCYTDDGHPPLVLARAVSRLSPEMIIVAAAGNHGNIDQIRADAGVKADQFAKGLYPTTPIWPAAFDDVIAVGAVDSSGKPAPFSPNLPWVDVTAPGVGVQSTYLTGRVLLESADPQTSAANPAAPAAPAVQEFEGAALWSGTSFAAANASGAIAACTKPGHRSARAALDSFMHPANGDVRPFFYSS